MSIFLRKQELKKGTYLSFVESFYDAKTQNSKQKVIKRIGYVDDLKKIYVNPIEKFAEEARKLSTASSKKYKDKMVAPIPKEERRRNLGYFLPLGIYRKFKMEQPFLAKGYERRFHFNPEKVFEFLVMSQIINPGSKSSEYLNKDIFFEDYRFSDDQMDDGIKFIGENEATFKEFILLRLHELYRLNTSTTYFDGTNIYFEIDKEDEERRRGPEKNNRHDPILGLGLLMDANGIPLNYTTFPGNESERPELHKNVQALKERSEIEGRTIIVADKGLNSGDNMYQAIKNGDGYVMGQKVRGASKETISWILQDDENSPYAKTLNKDGVVTYKVKSEVGEYAINITSPFNAQKATINLIQKRVVFYSKDYADKTQYERDKAIAKAEVIITNPKQFVKATVGTAANYIKELNFNEETGEIITKKLELDYEAIEKAKALDGYYMIITSETALPEDKIIEIYRGLWEIEETFSIIKGVLRIRPVFAKTLISVHAHILICFTGLLILRLLQKVHLRKTLSQEQIAVIEAANRKKRKHKIQYNKIVEYPVSQIVDFIRSFNAIKIEDKYYPTKAPSLIEFVEEKYAVKLNKAVLTTSDIKKIFSAKTQHTTKTLR